MDVVGKVQSRKTADQPKAGVRLARFKPEAGGVGEGVVVAVMRLAKGEQAKVRQVEALDGQACDGPGLLALVMGEMADGPMAGQGQGDADRYAPQNIGQAADGKEDEGERELLKLPCCLQPAQDWIASDAGFDGEARCLGQVKAAMHLPPGIGQKPASCEGCGGQIVWR